MTTSQKPTASEWMQKHGFGVFCIEDSGHTHFVIVPADDNRIAELTIRGLRLWEATGESGVKAQLVAAGLSAQAAQDAVALAKAWMTTVTRQPGAPRVLWELRATPDVEDSPE
jgi:hypothetical protein